MEYRRTMGRAVALVVLMGACLLAPRAHAAATPRDRAHSHALPERSFSPTIVHEWKFLNFTFETRDEYHAYMNGKHYMNCMPAGVKAAPNGDVFVSVPRWNAHVPATLSKVVVNEEGQQLLQPWPSWQMNKVGNVYALQSVLGFEIDSNGHLWALDQGKVNGAQALPGAIKLLVFNLETGEVVKKHVFSTSVASLAQSFLNDIVVDPKRRVAYITDSGLVLNPNPPPAVPLHPALIVYEWSSNTAWRVMNQVEAVNDQPITISINGEVVLSPQHRMRTGADGIALTRDGEWLYWCPLTSWQLYRIETSYLRTRTYTDDDRVHVTGSVTKAFASDGLALDSSDTLWLSNLEGSAVSYMDVGQPHPTGQSFIAVNDTERMMWPDTLALSMDGSGDMLFMSNQLHRFSNGELDWNDVNFRIWRVHTGSQSYLYDRHWGEPAEGLTKLELWISVLGGFLVLVCTVIFAVHYTRKRAKAREGTRYRAFWGNNETLATGEMQRP